MKGGSSKRAKGSKSHFYKRFYIKHRMPIFRQYERPLWIETLENDATPSDPILDEIVALSSDEVLVALNIDDYKPSSEDDDKAALEEDGHAQIDKIIIS